MRFELNSLATPSTQVGGAGTPLQLPVDAIDEDPLQPRQEYDSESLKQLADTIADRGVRQAVSVRSHPDAADRWILNFGSRRLRASKLAGKTEIPAFIDETADSYDQVIENEQREGLRPLELALFVQRELVAGRSRSEVARRLGKSAAYITYVCALIDPPDWLLTVYREGRCRGVRELYDLRRLHEENPEKVDGWLQDQHLVSRGAAAALREQIASPGPIDQGVDAGADRTAAGRSIEGQPNASIRSVSGIGQDRGVQGCGEHVLHISATIDDSIVQVLVESLPPDDQQVYVVPAAGGSPTAVAIQRLSAVCLHRRGRR